MADNVQFYTEGGMPSNRQVCGVRVSRAYGNSDNPLTAGDLYKLFDLDENEVVLAMGIDVLTASAAGTAAVTIDGVAIDAALTGVALTAVGKTAVPAASLPAAGATGVVEVTLTGATVADINIYAVVANVDTPTTFTKVDTLAP